MNYKNKFYKKYNSTHAGKDINNYNFKKNYIIFNSYFKKFLPKDKNKKILDLGCGDGSFISWLNSINFKNIEGVDISQEQVELAKKNKIKNIVLLDAKEYLKNNINKFDMIFARDFLEHFTKKEVIVILNLINKSLKKDGILVIQTVNAENIFWGRLRHGDFTHDLAFTSKSIKQLLKNNNFKEIKIFSQRPIIHGFKSFVRYLFWILFELIFKFYILVETGSFEGIFTQNIIVKTRK